jgi:hypothetical protein
VTGVQTCALPISRGCRVLRAIHGGLRLTVGDWIFLDCAGDRGQPRHYGNRGQPWRDGVGNIQGRCAGRDFANRSVGQMYGNCRLAHGGWVSCDSSPAEKRPVKQQNSCRGRFASRRSGSLGSVHTTGVDGVASENPARRSRGPRGQVFVAGVGSRARRLWRVHRRGRE